MLDQIALFMVWLGFTARNSVPNFLKQPLKIKTSPCEDVAARRSCVAWTANGFVSANSYVSSLKNLMTMM